MKTYNYILTGSLTMQVEAETAKQAEEKLQNYLEDNSPLRNWEVYDEGEGSDWFEKVDLTVK